MTGSGRAPARPGETGPGPRNNPVSGALFFLRGLSLITVPGIRLYVVVPFLINVTLFSVAIYFGVSQLNATIEAMLPEWLDFLHWILFPILLVVMLAISFFTFNLVANLISSPFNGLLAEAVERHLTGRSPELEGGWKKLLVELGQTLVNELRKLGYVAIRTLPLLLLLPIPLVGAIASLLWVALSAWMMAITFVDYPMANHGIGFPDQRRILRERRMLSLGFGGAVMAALAVPILNFLVIPCAVAGATSMWVEQLSSVPSRTSAGPPAERE